MYDDKTGTDERISTLFRDSTAEIEPDVAGLVRGGIDRGRVKRRRSNLAMVLAAAATVSVVGVTASVVSTLGSSGAGLDPAGSPAAAPATSTPPKATDPKSKPGRPPTIPTADIPVRAAELPGLFTKLYPGKITPAEKRTGRIMDDGRAGQYAHFRWNGFTTTVAFAAFTGTPAQRCRELYAGRQSVNCDPRPDGSVLTTDRDTAPDRDGGGTSYGATLFTEHGYEIFVMSYNTGLKEGPLLADEPPFSIAQLTRAVTSNVWY